MRSNLVQYDALFGPQPATIEQMHDRPGCTCSVRARTVSLPYFSVPDMDAALHGVRELGGEVIHPGERWSVCRDT